jgi:DNA-binding IclR family transcriptional regulator
VPRFQKVKLISIYVMLARSVFFVQMKSAQDQDVKALGEGMTEKQKRTGGRTARAKIDTELPRHGNRSIIVAVSLMKIIAGFQRPVTLSEIASAAGMSPTRAHRYLMGLVRTELVEQNPLTSRYDLGAQVLELGVAALGRVDAIRFGTEALINLTERVRIASLLCAWGTHGPTVLRWEQADLGSSVRIREGRNLSLLHSASGKVFLAHLPTSVTQPFLSAELRNEAKRSNGRALSLSDAERMKEEVRKRGLGISVGEEVSTFAAMSAPVFDVNGKLALSLTLIGTVSGLDTDPDGVAACALKETAARLSRRLGALPPPQEETPEPKASRGKARVPRGLADR